MKSSPLSVLFIAVLALSLGVTGCKKTSKGPTPIGNPRTQGPDGGSRPFPPVNPGPVIPSGEDPNAVPRNPTGIPTTDREIFENMQMDRDSFRLSTVYFEFDRHTIRSGERPRIEEVANALKANAANKLLVEGHCDERGTEEYNRALGERRALAIREYLANLGVSADRIRTLSYGEDRPAIDGHDEPSWEKNRRGEFILLRPLGN